MLTELFDYHLPAEAIAQRPTELRDGARMLEVTRELTDRAVRDFCELVPCGSLVVLNDTRVRQARLLGQRVPGGGQVEIFLLHPLDAAKQRWSALGRANKPLRAGTQIRVGGLTVWVDSRVDDGTLSVQLELGTGGALSAAPTLQPLQPQAEAEHAEQIEAALLEFGHVPLPPYVQRGDDADDRDRYQTVFSEQLGSVAAPTAGLHLTAAALSRLRARGVELGAVTLHVGVGTFRPVAVADLDSHPMHAESVRVSSELCQQVISAQKRCARVVAVGTTVVRALESAARGGHIQPFYGDTELLIQPGYEFRVVGALLTNFHMPKSTLLALVSAFAGRERVLQAYAEALARGYRFLSYGDAMWLPERLTDD